MAGHSKWANIKRHKEVIDSKRGKVFTKIIREITVAAKLSGGDVNANPRLRAAVDKALASNMTKDVIERAIKKGIGALGADDVEEIRYEGYGPGGIAVMVDCMTNNRNRTVSEVRHAFAKHGGNLGTDGSVSYLFQKQGQLIFAPDVNEDLLIETALQLNADDVVVNDDGSKEVLTTPENFLMIKTGLVAAGLAPAISDILMRAAINVDITDAEMADKVSTLLETLEDLDDVQAVYSNAAL